MTCSKHQVKRFKYYLYLLLYLDVNTTDINFATFILIKCSSLYSPSTFSKHKTPLMQIFTSIFFFICMHATADEGQWLTKTCDVQMYKITMYSNQLR